ncbi:histone-lysine N-methyltransferase ATXR4 [Mercurialis annua]|uniref:histone-lysine N-methyltransferase ATXR4 n=1 Tax=Mercurialis annua TaxID=3986 RepID=UPI00215F1869|nr:histone-lysine N-methyltransferase ATXR4 [Mercurialis annua]
MSQLVRYSRYLSRLKNPQFQTNHQLLTFSFSSISDNVKPAQPRPPPIRVGITESAGRGVFAIAKINTGELIHTAKPILSYPSLSSITSACYFCLRKINSFSVEENQNVRFCSQECKDNAKVFYDVETKADWSAFDDYCRTQGLKYPHMVKRLACMVMSGAASADYLDILQPSILSREAISAMEEGYGLLRSCFTKANIVDDQVSFLTKQWYINQLARIRINAFRIELAVQSYEDLLSSAAACIEAEAAVGNSVYMLPSFYNHDCDPNVHIIWIENADARLKALCDIEPDEELRICYIDASMEHDARQTILSEGFGFKCNCLRCLSGD